MAKHAEGRDRAARIVVPVTPAEHAYAKEVAGESGLAGKVREALRVAGLLPPLCGVQLVVHATREEMEAVYGPPKPRRERAAKAKRGGR